MIAKPELVKLLKKEFASTTRMLKAFPAERKDYKPHERSSDVMQLTATFVFEMYLLSAYVFGDTLDRGIFKTYKPESLNALISDFEKETSEIVRRFEQLPDSELKKKVEFGGRTFVADEFTMMMLFDQIHHRGQLSVYVRMAGGKVPSTYGPSADDESTNL